MALKHIAVTISRAEITDSLHLKKYLPISTRGGHRSGLPESTPAGFWVFPSDPDPESKICEKPDPDLESLLNFTSSRSLRGHFLSENMGEFRLDR